MYSGIPSISANGRFVAFESPAPDLVKGDRNHAVDVFLRDRKRGRTTLLSVSSEGEQGNSDSSFPAISANGRFVAFSSLASSLVAGDRHNTADTFVRGPLRSGAALTALWAADELLGSPGRRATPDTPSVRPLRRRGG